jgi:hypothetical protein
MSRVLMPTRPLPPRPFVFGVPSTYALVNILLCVAVAVTWGWLPVCVLGAVAHVAMLLGIRVSEWTVPPPREDVSCDA